ncbi:MAG TPA: succinate dehydrogenase assembly factor 2 family protein [Gammaproteobacteria bacterium]|uniref:YgfY COG2938 n=1 Tax=hydrothermal vent metagenome TaxID=652676 RepID=A0A160TT24_9ZZZZ|nr:succinate dehydrogenase assembly factor 2 [Arenicellales bacterium]HIF79419.1 succinate dehydrogenase assembly factor 2 family protein [Gammaproteobacteria bacterium]HIM05683.1 succinate dehydrogenase assembly factor 2 family protein [Gammaproteobacteria bacterium]
MKADRAKILWRCRRGIRELDSVLKPFVEDCYDELSPLDKTRLQTLLGHQDTQILDWILGREIPDEEGLQTLLDSIIRYSKESRVT